MQQNSVFDPSVFDKERVKGFQKAFNINPPIRHLVIDNFLDRDVAFRLFSDFPALEEMNTKYRGLNEKKAEHSDFSDLDPAFKKLHAALASSDFIEWLGEVTGIAELQAVDDRLGYGLHQGGNHSFLDIHIDYNIHPIRKLYRKLNLIIFLNERWEKNWGGNLELWDSDVKNCIQSILPVFNRCAIFECSDISYHGYKKIEVPEGITRKSFYHYYFTPVGPEASFHDTIFKPRPEEPTLKKVLTYVKDYAKNKAKNVLVKFGWKRFLK